MLLCLPICVDACLSQHICLPVFDPPPPPPPPHTHTHRHTHTNVCSSVRLSPFPTYLCVDACLSQHICLPVSDPPPPPTIHTHIDTCTQMYAPLCAYFRFPVRLFMHLGPSVCFSVFLLSLSFVCPFACLPFSLCLPTFPSVPSCACLCLCS